MAGAIKHMERSHRSYGKNHSAFGGFRAKATARKSSKDMMKKSGFFASIIGKFKSHTKKGAK